VNKFIVIVSLLTVILGAHAIGFAQENNYIIGPGDVLEISVWKDESLNRDVVVPPDGMIAYPLIGDIKTNGMTVTMLRKAITTKLSEYVPDATVTVILKNISSLKAFVIGKVNNPGQFSITMDTTVMQILAMAKGLNPFADAGDIHILRRRKNVTVKIPFNYKEVEKGYNLEQNIVLQRGDVVVVP
jgi:polysaccharide biosynthesis/export protein